MDCRNSHPPTQEGKTFRNKLFSGFALSLQGASHADKDPAVPCQDYSDMRYVKGTGLLIAAIADGVGSCQLSHWGAYTAVIAALDSTAASLSAHISGSRILLDSNWNPEIKRILVDAFRAAREAVEQLADNAGELVYHFQSTLTLAIYDGTNLLYGHVGDDGIVIQMEDGSVEMLTARLKGEEASSVYPLQSGEKNWKFGRAAKPVAGFLMATDGVLDSFVTSHSDYFGINYNKGVCYSFMGDAMYTLAKNTSDAPTESLNRYRDFLMRPDYRSTVTDDLTMIAVVSNELIGTVEQPRFDFELWTAIQQKSYAAKKQHLNGKPLPVASLADLVSDIEPMPAFVPQAPAEPDTPEFAPVVPTPPKPRKPDFSTPAPTSPARKPIFFLCAVVAAAVLSVAFLLLGIYIGRTFLSSASAELYQTVIQERDDAIAQRDTLAQENETLKEAVDTLAQENARLKQTTDVQQPINPVPFENTPASEETPFEITPEEAPTEPTEAE